MSAVKKLAAVATLTLCAMSAQAASISYFLNQTNTAALPDGTNYLKVTISDSGNDILFHIETLTAVSSLAGTNFGLDKFGFNSNRTLTASNFSGLPTGWSFSGSGNLNGFGNFSSTLSGNGGNRLSVLDFSIINIVGDNVMDYVKLSTGASPSEGNQFFAGHVAGLTTPSGTTSAFIAGQMPVPLPAAAWLLGSGLLGLLGLARKKS